MPKMWKANERQMKGRTDVCRRTMDNRPWHKLTCSKAPGELLDHPHTIHLISFTCLMTNQPLWVILDRKVSQQEEKEKYRKMRENWFIELGFNDMSTLVGYFVSSTRDREKRDSRGDEGEGQGRKENEWKWRNWRNKNLPLLPLPATKIAGLAQM